MSAPPLETEKKRKKILILVGILLAIAAAAFFYDNYRNGVMARLYAEGAGYPPYYRGSIESQSAVKALARYRGQRSTDMLLDIALRQNPLAPAVQTEAIKALSARRDPEIAIRLTSLLQPHEGLGTRQAAANALQNLPCNRECLGYIMHYLERIWRGEPNDEDRWILPPGNDQVIANYRAGQKTVYDNLYSILRREKLETLAILKQVYGLGSDGPSPFALDLVSRLGATEACPLLQQSSRSTQGLPAGTYRAPREEIQSALGSLNCK